MRIKVCCIKSTHEARLALEAGAELLGLVSETLEGPGAISDEQIRSIATGLSEGVVSCLLTAETNPGAIAAHAVRTGVHAIQLVGEISPRDVARLRERLPGRELIKVVHVEGDDSTRIAAEYGESADTLLLDSAVRDPQGDRLGGTGRVHDWRVSRDIVRASRIPVLLAGGLTPENVSEAIDAVRPAGVDVCSGLRPTGVLEPRLARRFCARSKAAAI